MALPRSREQLKDYCLRKLGYPVIEINVDNEQLEDRLDESLAYFQDFHFDGVQRIYLKHEVTASRFKTSSITGTFEVGEKITGGTSGSEAHISSLDGTDILFSLVTRVENHGFIAGETLTGGRSGATAVLSSATDYITLGDIDNGYIPTTDQILSVIEIFPLSSYNSSSSKMFDVRYQFALNNMHTLTGMNLIGYDMFKRHLALFSELFEGDKFLRHNRKQDRLYIDADWGEDIRIGDYIVAECYAILNPETFTEVYSDLWLRRYTEQLFKQQWGSNLKKYNNMQLPGGVTLDGQTIYQEATGEIQRLEDEMESRYQEPPNFIVG